MAGHLQLRQGRHGHGTGEARSAKALALEGSMLGVHLQLL
jgi:hypothetical protein